MRQYRSVCSIHGECVDNDVTLAAHFNDKQTCLKHIKELLDCLGI